MVVIMWKRMKMRKWSLFVGSRLLLTDGEKKDRCGGWRNDGVCLRW